MFQPKLFDERERESESGWGEERFNLIIYNRAWASRHKQDCEHIRFNANCRHEIISTLPWEKVTYLWLICFGMGIPFSGEEMEPTYLTYKSAWYFLPLRTPSSVGFSLFLKLSVQSYTAETIKNKTNTKQYIACEPNSVL